MTIKADVLWTMARRYQKAAVAEEDLSEAEKLTAKAVEYHDRWAEACSQ